MQIADDIRATITSGKLAPGDRLDSSRELATKYNVAPMTIHQAMRQLRIEGLVVSAQGRGVFVAEPGRAETSPDGADLARVVHELRRDLDRLTAQAASDTEHAGLPALRDEVTELRRQVGAVQAQLIELYGRMGLPNPQQAVKTDEAGKRPSRKASGA
jgi:DNA-binding transcriptional regulator YhcF (GntR family)